MKFLRQFLGITKLDKEKNQCIRGKNGSREYSNGNKTVSNFILRIKEQETQLILPEHDDDENS
jgi:hypothetical protein